MQQLTRDDIVTLLQAMDKHLSKPAHVLIIGGSAITLAYNPEKLSQDIDTRNALSKDVLKALRLAQEETGIRTHFGPAGVDEFPWDFDSRLVTADIPGLKNLRVSLPEKHDLVLSKTIRGYEKDVDGAQAVAQGASLDFDTLIERMNTEMSHVHGDKKVIKLNFFDMVSRVFGEDYLKKAKASLRKW